MKYLLIILCIAHQCRSCCRLKINCGTIAELNHWQQNAKAGDHIFLKDGVYKDAVIKFSNNAGTENSPVTVSAQHPGKVFLEGNSSISFSGQYIHIKDLVFQNGGHELKNKQVIEFRVSEKEQASHCTVSDCVINDFNNTIKTDVNAWVGSMVNTMWWKDVCSDPKTIWGQPWLYGWIAAGRPIIPSLKIIFLQE
jgi:poly(beta-D-mannuronate) lyase